MFIYKHPWLWDGTGTTQHHADQGTCWSALLLELCHHAGTTLHHRLPNTSCLRCGHAWPLLCCVHHPRTGVWSLSCPAQQPFFKKQKLKKPKITCTSRGEIYLPWPLSCFSNKNAWRAHRYIMFISVQFQTASASEYIIATINQTSISS